MVAHYTLLERLGESGLGEVFRARDTKVGRTVAVTLLAEDLLTDPSERRAFTEAVRAASALSHPNIATLFEAGEHEGRGFLVYELAAGTTLRQDLGGQPVNPMRALELTIQVADALADAHARNLLHGNLHPETVVVTPRGSAKVLDFGLAPWSRHARRTPGASQGAAEPSAANAYRSPEQAIGARSDDRSDVFSLAVILYEMLAGRLPVQDTMPENLKGWAPRPPSDVNPAVPAALDRVVLRALSTEPDSRYQTAATFGAELRGVAAVLKVRSADRDAAEPLSLPEAPLGRATWVAAVVVVMFALILAWYVL